MFNDEHLKAASALLCGVDDVQSNAGFMVNVQLTIVRPTPHTGKVKIMKSLPWLYCVCSQQVAVQRQDEACIRSYRLTKKILHIYQNMPDIKYIL